VLALAVLRPIMIIFYYSSNLLLRRMVHVVVLVNRKRKSSFSLGNHFFRDIINNIRITRNIIHSNECDDT
jgi:hypothetical protein